MKRLTVQNQRPFELSLVPELTAAEFEAEGRQILSEGSRMMGLFEVEKTSGGKKVLAVFGNNETSQIYIVKCVFPKEGERFRSFAYEFPNTNYFECELAENSGILPEGHPWLRPVRKQNTILGNIPYQFYRVEGDEVHEVAVGPVHAGVIEPGHFRFQCHGETVYHLEISLGYQHRGIEKLLLKADDNKRALLVESIAGDTVIGHSMAYSLAMEALSKTGVSLRASVIRSIAEELERVAMHLSGLSGVANDVGFAIGAAAYGRLRTLVINSLLLISGSRFGRGLVRPGGVMYDLTEGAVKKITENLLIVQKDIAEINDFMFSSTSVMTRLEATGKVHYKWASEVGMVGPAARASGVKTDVRQDFPYGAYRYHATQTVTLDSGDVFARARIRSLEIEESLGFILERFVDIPQGEIFSEVKALRENTGVISLSEGWRGEIMHAILTGPDGKISSYKVKDPSFNNWYGLALSVRGEGISNFPLCNKSFDLSYSGHDL
ncbi:MAG: hydrogenase [Ignavibacteria bacterium]|jgi:Ni,Fe-hydrogenase III large subunit|nr:hydrogenase [Ignavibacteria bacterium]MCU7518924.1 hydrogenase [Ignavibacteria bacterium]MCU7525146.1 hydrogenase [Ignavibacteria bacterium]